MPPRNSPESVGTSPPYKAKGFDKYFPTPDFNQPENLAARQYRAMLFHASKATLTKNTNPGVARDIETAVLSSQNENENEQTKGEIGEERNRRDEDFSEEELDNEEARNAGPSSAEPAANADAEPPENEKGETVENAAAKQQHGIPEAEAGKHGIPDESSEAELGRAPGGRRGAMQQEEKTEREIEAEIEEEIERIKEISARLAERLEEIARIYWGESEEEWVRQWVELWVEWRY